MPQTSESVSDRLRAALEEIARKDETVRELLREKHEPIAVVGMGLRAPGGNDDPDGFADFLRAGKSGIRPLPDDRRHLAPGPGADEGPAGPRPHGGFLDGIDRFDAAFFNISPKEAAYVDPHQRLVLETAWQALEHAGIDPTALRHGDTGVYMGVTTLDYIFEATELAAADVDGYLAPGLTHSGVSGRLSYALGLRGPSLTVDTTCSSSLAAAHLAVQALRGRECGLALCGGVNVIHNALGHVVLRDGGMLAPDGRCKTFDDSADGYGRAEGCGVLVLKRLSDARRDGDTVHAVIRGSAVGQDGESAGLTAPNGAAQEAVMRAAVERCGLTPGDIQYVEAHGTGTALGDPTEIAAISDVFAQSHSPSDPVLVGSLKTNVGHMEGAAGVGSIIKAVLQLREGTVFPHLNFDRPSRRIAWADSPVAVPVEQRPWPAAGTRRALVNGFGVTGTIAAVVLEQAPEAPEVPEADQGVPERAGAVFTLSAKSRKSLRVQAERYRRHLAENPGLAVDDLCYTANTGRAHFRYRIAGPVRETGDVSRLLDGHIARSDRGEATGNPGVPKVAFLFAGMGSPYPGMGAALYRRYPVFRDRLDECDRLFAPLLALSIRDVVLGEDGDPGRIDQARNAQPALFSLEYALAGLWLSWGLRPSVLIGHSLGELTAAAVSGLFPLEDAVRVVAVRGRLSGSVAQPGGMAAVGAPAEEVVPFLEPYPDLVVGAVNGPTQCLLSGGAGSLAEVGRALEDEGIKITPLRGSVPYHSPLLAGILDDFRAVLETVRFGTPNMTIVSNVTGQVVRAAQLATPDYWVRHLVSPVSFEAGVHAVEKRGRHAFVEIGPSTAMTALARTCARDDGHLWLGSTYRDDKDAEMIRRSLAQLYCAGLPVSWTGYHQGRHGRRVQLPGYAFDRRPYWLPTPRRQRAEAEWRAERSRQGTRDAEERLLYEERWVERPLPERRRSSRRVLVLGLPRERRARLAAGAAEAGVRLDFCDDGAELDAALRDTLPTDLCWFWRPVAHAAADATGTDRLRAEAEANYRDLLAVTRTLAERNFGRNQRLWLVTEGAQHLPGDVPGERPGIGATLWGFGRALGVECPGYQVTLVDLPPGGDDPGTLLGELLAADDTEFERAHRGGRRWVRRLTAAEPDGGPAAGAAPREPVVVRPDRTYVIAGGLGALGLAIARRLVELGARHLALLGRGGDRGAAPFPAADGVQATVYRCDIGSAPDVARVMARLADGPHPVAGIVHAAGTEADRPLAGQTWESMEEVFRTKVYGAWLLHQAAADLPELDFFLACSTASALVGAATQANSCAGNAFLDRLMAWRAARGLPALAVNWGPWAPGDPQRQLSASLVRSWESQGIGFLAPARAVATLSALLETGRAQVMVGHCDWQRFAARRPANALYSELVADSGPAADAVLDPGALSAAPDRERTAAISRTVRARIADVLRFDGVEDVEPDAELAALGLDSLNAVELRGALEAAFRVTLPASITFDQPSVDLLTEYLDRLLAASSPAA